MLLFFMDEIDTAFDMLVAVQHVISTACGASHTEQKVAGDDIQKGALIWTSTPYFLTVVFGVDLTVTLLNHVPVELISRPHIIKKKRSEFHANVMSSVREPVLFLYKTMQRIF